MVLSPPDLLSIEVQALIETFLRALRIRATKTILRNVSGLFSLFPIASSEQRALVYPLPANGRRNTPFPLDASPEDGAGRFPFSSSSDILTILQIASRENPVYSLNTPRIVSHTPRLLPEYSPFPLRIPPQ